jgi:hypothetical protein
MYENEQAQAKADFVRRFVHNTEDFVLLRIPEGTTRICVFCTGEDRLATNSLHDYEDDVSGGAAVCEEHSSEFVFESGPQPEWVTQDPEGAWNGIGAAAGNGWSGLWFLFAPPGRYASPMSKQPGEWPPAAQEAGA